MDLAGRVLAPELMDTEATDFATFEDCLRDLERINRWTFAYRITLGWLDRLHRAHGGVRRLAILDVGAGYGDMLRRIGAWGRARGLELELVALDRNPHAARAAEGARSEVPIRYLTAEVFEVPEAVQADVVISALFAHHLDDGQLVRFLGWMERRARLGWLINDLHRHALPYWIARHGPRLLGMNRLVRHDAAVSVARSFDRRDWQRLLAAAGLAPPLATVAWRLPFRYAVSRIK